MNSVRDVIIIGAGPSGSFLAGLLAERGIDVLLLEEHASPGDEVICSGIIGMEAFDRFDLPEKAVVGLLKEIRFISPSGKTVDFNPERPLAKIVSRKIFDSSLADHAVEKGSELLTRSRVDFLSVNDGFVEVGVNREGDRISLKTRLCILATGYGSSLVRRAGFRSKGSVIQGAQTLFNSGDEGPARIFLGSRVAPEGFGWSVPMGEGHSRVGVVAAKKGPHHLRQILSGLSSAGPGVSSSKLESALKGIEACPIPVGALETSVSNRMMVVGEAAGQVKTTTQGGIYYGLLCADAAASTVSEAFRVGDLSRKGLGSYERRWRRRLESELSMGVLLRQFLSELSDRQIDCLFDIARIDGVLPLIRKKARFDWHAPVIHSFLNNGFLGAIVRSVLGLCPIRTKAL